MSRFQSLIDQLLDLTVELNYELKAAGLDQDLPELWEQACRSTDAQCLLETALVDAGLVEGARTEEEAIRPVARLHEIGSVLEPRGGDDIAGWARVDEDRPIVIH